MIACWILSMYLLYSYLSLWQRQIGIEIVSEKKKKKERNQLFISRPSHLPPESEAVGVKRAWEANVLVLQKRSEDHSASYQHLEKLLAQQAGLKAEVGLEYDFLFLLL